MHRLWTCPANRPSLARLCAILRQRGFCDLAANLPASLPPCLARAALLPDGPLPRQAAELVQEYLLEVARTATRALAEHDPG